MFIQSKKALSIVVGYVLLIVFASVVGVIVYKWQQTYVPKDEYAGCTEGASLFIVNKSYDCNTNILRFAIKNTGQFSIGGYFIYLKDDQEKTLATVDISNNNTDISSKLIIYNINGVKLGRETLLPARNNSFEPGEVEIEEFDLSHLNDNVYGIEIVPIRWQEEGRKEVLASCKENRISEVFDGCSEMCIPLSISEICGERVCGKMLNNCYNEIECTPGCGEGEFCDSTGNCIVPVDCTDTCESLNFECGSVCGVPCGEYNGACLGSDICDEDTGQCVLEGSGGGGTGEGCWDYCNTLGFGYTTSSCTRNEGLCKSAPGTPEPGGDYLCTDPNRHVCCCHPQR